MLIRALRPHLFLLLVAAIFAGNILVGKALAGLPPFTISLGRVFIALLIMLPLGWHQARRGWPLFREHWRPLVGLALTGVAFFNALIYAALNFTSATNVAILESMIPVVTLLFSVALLGERFRVVQWLGVALSLAGAVTVITAGQQGPALAAGINPGDAIMLLAVLVWVGYSLLVKTHMARFPRYGGLLVMLVIANLALAPIALFEGAAQQLPQISGEQLLGLAYLGIFPSVVALLLYNSALADIGPTRAAIYLNLLPVFTMLGAWWWLDERIVALQVLASAVVIVGVWLTIAPRRTS
ncbi:DMT family transporter [Franzmannia qiaohouensis]|uniref:DMT family transporter n=1 Tax=Franzmannia qiaohouensis TaxID=1329370 RepID=A0ABU1HHY7_9GAMM|nr:DMT family transporter [Halomonas qiaohouensis]MDR5907102.1 DMT family transporter [Halomonas qiaohouensis]